MNNDSIFGNVIYSYTRANALDDGVLVDITKAPATIEAGIRIPVAVTNAVFNVLDPDEKLRSKGQSFEGRLWDLWTIFKHELKRKTREADEIHFAPLFLTNDRQEPVPIKMWAKCGPGDNAEPVITIMLEGED